MKMKVKVAERDAPGQPYRNAERYLSEHCQGEDGHRLMLSHHGEFRRWDGSAWRPVAPADLRAHLYAWLEEGSYRHQTKDEQWEYLPFSPTRHKLSDVVDALHGAANLPADVEVPAWIGGDGPAPAGEFVACANGLVHVPTRKLLPATPDLYVHHALPFSYDPGAPPPARWLAFLDDLWGGDLQAIEVVQEWCGYTVSGETDQHKALLMVGPKRAGKGTLATVLGGLVGTHNVAGPTLSSLGANFGLAQLLGKPLAVVADARLRSADDITTERLLAITGEDVVTVDRKYREPWTGRLPTRFMLMSNELPRLSDASGALASRFIVLTLQTSFYGREDHGLKAALLAELPGILLWALDGLDRLHARGHFIPPASSDQAVRDLEELGSPITAFVRERCEVGGGHQVPMEGLYDEWREWCQVQGRQAGSVQSFARDLRALVPGVSTIRHRMGGVQIRHYQGIRLILLGGESQ